jgi:ABC-2 type transport system ATP-binding protein
VVAELERLCDWLIVLNGGRLQLAGAVDDLVAGHTVLTVPRQLADGDLPGRVIERTDSDRHSTVLVAADPGLVPVAACRAGWAAAAAGFEQLVLAYLRRPPGQAAGATEPLDGTGAAGRAVAS